MNGVTLADHLREYAGEIENQVGKIHCKPTKSSVHDLRVAIRRARSVLWIARCGQKIHGLKKINRRLRKLNRKLGRVRELDVAISDAHDFRINDRKLKKRRKKMGKKIAHSMTRKNRKRIHKNLDTAARKITNADTRVVESGLAQLRDQLLHWRNAALSHKDEIHAFRIFVKRARYVLESLDQNAQPLAKLQDVLGFLHDLEVLQSLTGQRRQVQEKAATARAELAKAQRELDVPHLFAQ
jgi:CHAD domain-containing protein